MKKIFLITVTLGVFFFALAFLFVSVKGRGLVVAELETVTGRKVTLGAVHPGFPVGLILKDLRIEGLARIPMARITVHLHALLGGHLEIASIELRSPEINIVLPAPVQSASPASGGSKAALVSVKPVVGEGKRSPLIDLVVVNDGTIMIQAPSTGKTWILEKVQAHLWHPVFDGTPIRTDFVVGASLAKLNVPFVGHLAKAKGWVNWAARDMQANVEALDEEGHVGLSATLTSHADDCEVKGRALLASTQEVQATAKRSKMIEAAVLDLLGSSQTDLAVDFSFHTPLDHFEVGRVNISGNITTGLQTEEISGNIVGGLKAAGARLLDKDKASMVKPYKL